MTLVTPISLQIKLDFGHFCITHPVIWHHDYVWTVTDPGWAVGQISSFGMQPQELLGRISGFCRVICCRHRIFGLCIKLQRCCVPVRHPHDDTLHTPLAGHVNDGLQGRDQRFTAFQTKSFLWRPLPLEKLLKPGNMRWCCCFKLLLILPPQREKNAQLSGSL